MVLVVQDLEQKAYLVLIPYLVLLLQPEVVARQVQIAQDHRLVVLEQVARVSPDYKPERLAIRPALFHLKEITAAMQLMAVAVVVGHLLLGRLLNLHLPAATAAQVQHRLFLDHL